MILSYLSSIGIIFNIWQKKNLADDDGIIKKQPNDYDVRAGQTTPPIAAKTVRSVQVHMDCYDHLVIHLAAVVKNWID